MATDQPLQTAGDGGGIAAPEQVIRREGEYWTIVFGGVTCRLRDGRGLQHLRVLLLQPHQQISALFLERCGINPDEVACGTVPLHDARERARVNVTRAIATALKRIGEHHPALGEHLAVTIHTGMFCSYTPDPRVSLRWAE
jgi:hypothetical protein